jgi:hypothetical protein
MNANSHPGTLLHDGQPLPAFRRLVVLIPNADLDEIRLARRIRSMMSPYKAGILLLSTVIREEEGLLERRRLTNLATLLRDPYYTVTSKTISAKHWVGEIKENLLPGDLLVCLKGQNSPSWSLKSHPVGQTLAGHLPCPVYVLHNIAIKEVLGQTLSHRILGWVVPIVIILLFIGFDVRIAKDAAGWVSVMLLSIAMLVEIGLIWGWNYHWN